MVDKNTKVGDIVEIDSIKLIVNFSIIVVFYLTTIDSKIKEYQEEYFNGAIYFQYIKNLRRRKNMSTGFKTIDELNEILESKQYYIG